MLNLVSLSTQSLASCVNYFVWNCLTCFSTTKIGSVTSFSILFNFQGPVRPSLAADGLIILPQKRFFVKLFFSRLLNVLNLDHSQHLSVSWCFWTSIGSFQGLLAEVSEVTLLSQRLALKYNTTPPAFCQHFSASFFCLFCNPFRRAEIDTIWMSSASRWASSEVASFIFAACPERSFQMTGSRCGPVPDFPI